MHTSTRVLEATGRSRRVWGRHAAHAISNGSEETGRGGVRTLVFLAAMAFIAVTPSYGQSFDRVEETNSNISSYYYHVRPGAATMHVQVLGTVRQPGLYVINQGTELGELLALTGGPVMGTREHGNKRQVQIRLYRHQSPSRAMVYDASLDESIENPDAYPVLQDGDVLSVEVLEKRLFGWRDVFTVTGAVAALALAAERLSGIGR